MSKQDTWYSKVFAAVYDSVLSIPEEKVLTRKRKSLLENLKGNILEVGSGTGVNFSLYGKDAKVLACEPSEAMMKRAKEKIKTENIKAEIELLNEGVFSEALSERILPLSLDAVVCTLVLCTIPAPEKALELFYNWLKPDGKLILLEHILSKNKAGRFMQDMITPLWKRLAEGCRLNRHTDEMAKQTGFRALKESYFSYTMPFYEAVLVKQEE